VPPLVKASSRKIGIVILVEIICQLRTEKNNLSKTICNSRREIRKEKSSGGETDRIGMNGRVGYLEDRFLTDFSCLSLASSSGCEKGTLSTQIKTMRNGDRTNLQF
jgi:hypothetical protein